MYVILAIAVSMVAMLAVSVVAAGQSARRNAAVAADLAALAGAEVVRYGAERACAVAADVARANDGELVDCLVDGYHVEVAVQVEHTGVAAPWLSDARRRARAGPA